MTKFCCREVRAAWEKLCKNKDVSALEEDKKKVDAV